MLDIWHGETVAAEGSRCLACLEIQDVSFAILRSDA
jgi:hypothetical protein